MALMKNSYQKKVKPVDRAAFSRLGERPLKNPRGPSSLAIVTMQSTNPWYVRTFTEKDYILNSVS